MFDFWVSSLVKPWKANLSLRTTCGRGRKDGNSLFQKRLGSFVSFQVEQVDDSSHRRSTPGCSQTVRNWVKEMLVTKPYVCWECLGERVLTGSLYDSIFLCEGEGQSFTVCHPVVWAWPHSTIFKPLVTHPSCHFLKLPWAKYLNWLIHLF